MTTRTEREVAALLGIDEPQRLAEMRVNHAHRYLTAAFPMERARLMKSGAFWIVWRNLWEARDQRFVSEETDRIVLIPDGEEGAETTFSGAFTPAGLHGRYTDAHRFDRIDARSFRTPLSVIRR